MLNIKINESNFIPGLSLQTELSFPETGIALISGENGIGKSTLCSFLYHENLLPSDIIWSEAQQFRSIYPVTVESVLSVYKKNASHLNEERFEKLSKLFNIASFMDRTWNELSSGQGQMLKLLMGLSLKARTYLLDEPAHFLDQIKLNGLSEVMVEISKDSLVVLIDHRIDWLKENPAVHLKMLVCDKNLILEKQ